MSIEKAQGLTLPHNIPENARRALTLAGMIEKAGAGELAPKDMKEALEFCTLVSSGLVHLSHYTLELIGAVREDDTTPAEATVDTTLDRCPHCNQ